MKNVKILFVLMSVMTLIFSACSDGIGSSSDLIGTWEAVSETRWEKRDGVVTNEFYDDLSGSIRITFNKNGTYVLTYLGGDTDDSSEGEWSYSKGILILDYDEEDPWSIKELTRSKLVVEGYTSSSVNGVFYESYYLIEYRKI